MNAKVPELNVSDIMSAPAHHVKPDDTLRHIHGLMRVQLDSGVPIVSMVLTPHQFHDHGIHENFFREHFKVKGAEAAAVCIDVLAALSPPLATKSP